MCVHSGMWFCSETRHLQLLSEVFSQTLSLCAVEKVCVVVLICCELYAFNIKMGFMYLRVIKAALPFCSLWKSMFLCGLQKHKHMPQEFEGNNLAS